MITAVNKATGQGLEVVGPANRLGAGLRPHGSSATPISVPAATAAIRTNGRLRGRIVLFLLSPCFFIPLPLHDQQASRPRQRARTRCGSTELWKRPRRATAGGTRRGVRGGGGGGGYGSTSWPSRLSRQRNSQAARRHLPSSFQGGKADEAETTRKKGKNPKKEPSYRQASERQRSTNPSKTATLCGDDKRKRETNT